MEANAWVATIAATLGEALSEAEGEVEAPSPKEDARAPLWSYRKRSEDGEASADAVFAEAMHEQGLSVTEMDSDGNCLFRSISDQVYGNPELHNKVRKACVRHMTKHKARFGVFYPGNFRTHLANMKRPTVWGDDLEIRAMEEVFDRPVEIYSADAEDLKPMIIDFDAATTVGIDGDTTPIRLSYHGGCTITPSGSIASNIRSSADGRKPSCGGDWPNMAALPDHPRGRSGVEVLNPLGPKTPSDTSKGRLRNVRGAET